MQSNNKNMWAIMKFDYVASDDEQSHRREIEIEEHVEFRLYWCHRE